MTSKQHSGIIDNDNQNRKENTEMARPRKEDARRDQVCIKVTEGQKQAIKEFAALYGMGTLIGVALAALKEYRGTHTRPPY